MSDRIEVVVVGGGFSGSLIATQLAVEGKDVLLLEASDSPGGIAQTVIEDGFVLEPAAGTFMLPIVLLLPSLMQLGLCLRRPPPRLGSDMCGVQMGSLPLSTVPKHS